MPDRPKRVLVVGGGAIARRAHLPAWRALEQSGKVELAGVVEPDEAAAATLRAEVKTPIHASLDDALAASTIDVLSLCTPPSAHARGVATALAAGVSAIVEKPLVAGIDDLRELAASVAAHRGPRPFIAVVQNYRYYRCVERALARRDAGVLGRLVSMTGHAPARFPVSWTRSTWLYDAGGVFVDFAPHLVDLFVLFANRPLERVVAFGQDVSGGSMGFASHGQIMAELGGGVLATLDCSWVTGTNLLRVGLHGTGGHAELDVKNDYYREIHGTYTPFDDARDFKERVVSTARRIVVGEYFRGPLAFYRRLFEDFLASVDAGRPATPCVATLAQGLNASALVACALESAARKRIVEVSDVLDPSLAALLGEDAPPGAHAG